MRSIASTTKPSTGTAVPSKIDAVPDHSGAHRGLSRSLVREFAGLPRGPVWTSTPQGVRGDLVPAVDGFGGAGRGSGVDGAGADEFAETICSRMWAHQPAVRPQVNIASSRLPCRRGRFRPRW